MSASWRRTSGGGERGVREETAPAGGDREQRRRLLESAEAPAAVFGVEGEEGKKHEAAEPGDENGGEEGAYGDRRGRVA